MYILAALLCALLLEHYLRREGQLSRFEKLLVPLGVISYSFYLWHETMIVIVFHFLKTLPIPIIRGQLWNASFSAILIFGIVFVFAQLLYRFVELPSVAWGKALWQNRDREPAKPIPRLLVNSSPGIDKS
jgi:peptidoglycan/LPS O-acetylase OafA/YrhL